MPLLPRRQDFYAGTTAGSTYYPTGASNNYYYADYRPTGTSITTTNAATYSWMDWAQTTAAPTGQVIWADVVTAYQAMRENRNYWYQTPALHNACADLWEPETLRIDHEREEAYAEAQRDLGDDPHNGVFEQWWQEARMERARGRRDRDQMFLSWIEDHPEEVRAVRRERRYNAHVTENGIEAGFIRQEYQVDAQGYAQVRHVRGRGEAPPEREGHHIEVVWWRVEVNFETGRPQAIRMKGRPSRRERRAYERVTARQEAFRIAQEAMARVAEEERRRLEIAAQERAEALLTANLTIRQRHSLATNGFFEVRGSEGGTYHVTNQGQAGNVFEVVNGRRVLRFCIHPYGGREPSQDVWLAQKLMLETNEVEFKRLANASRVGVAA